MRSSGDRCAYARLRGQVRCGASDVGQIGSRRRVTGDVINASTVKDYVNSLGARLGEVRRVRKSTEEVSRGSGRAGLGFSLLAVPSTTCGPEISRSRQEARVKSRDKSYLEVYL
jgi:hypothetical protein